MLVPGASQRRSPRATRATGRTPLRQFAPRASGRNGEVGSGGGQGAAAGDQSTRSAGAAARPSPAVLSGAWLASSVLINGRHLPQRMRWPLRRYMQPTVRQRPLAAVSRQQASLKRLQMQTIMAPRPATERCRM